MNAFDEADVVRSVREERADLGLIYGPADDLRVLPFEPEIPLLLTAVYSRRRPVSRVLTRFMTTLRATLRQTKSQLDALRIKAELV